MLILAPGFKNFQPMVSWFHCLGVGLRTSRSGSFVDKAGLCWVGKGSAVSWLTVWLEMTSKGVSAGMAQLCLAVAYSRAGFRDLFSRRSKVPRERGHVQTYLVRFAAISLIKVGSPDQPLSSWKVGESKSIDGRK